MSLKQLQHPNNPIKSLWLSFPLTYYSNKHDFPNNFTRL